MKKQKPDLSTGLPEKECSCGGTNKMRPSEEKVNQKEQLILVEARGRYPQGASWRVQAFASDLQTAFTYFVGDGIKEIRVISSTAGTSSRGSQSRGEPMLFLGVIGGEARHD